MATWKDSVRLATTAKIPDLRAVGSIDGHTIVAADRVLVKDQENPVDNGIYRASATTTGTFKLDRAPDMRPVPPDPNLSQATVRVSEGNQNAGTQWRLRAPGPITVGTTSLPWIHENRTYSVESIAVLKELVGAPLGSTASVAGYERAGDNGGGDFSFVGVRRDPLDPPTWHVSEVRAESVVITDWSPFPEGPSPDSVMFTTNDHPDRPFSTGQSVYLSDVGSASGSHIITLDSQNPTTRFLVKGITTAELGTNPSASCVMLTVPNHGRPSGAQRLAVSGVRAETTGGTGTPPPVDINRIWDRSAVFNENTLTLPVPLPAPVPAGWSYMPGEAAVVGDDALYVTATDDAGEKGGVWKRTITTPFHVAWWGALGDPDKKIAGKQIDDSPAINAAINAAKRFRDYVPGRRNSGSRVCLGPGVYRCASKILIDGCVSLEGTSPGYGSGAAMLIFDLDMGDGDALVDIANVSTDGSGTSGAGARICNLQVAQDPDSWPANAMTYPLSVENFNERVRTAGIRVRAAGVTLEDIFVHAIQGHGILIHGDKAPDNANLWCIKGRVSVHRCLESGVVTEGDDANAGAQSGTLDVTACGAWGVHEHSQHGNSWSTIHTAGNGFQVAGTPPDWRYSGDESGAPVPQELKWAPGKQIRLGQRILPTFSEDPAEDHNRKRRRGYTYRATKVTGERKTGAEEPKWPIPQDKSPTVDDFNVLDGDVTWTRWSHEGGALYHEGHVNWSTYEYLYVENEQPCRFDSVYPTASVKQVFAMHPSSHVASANAGTSKSGLRPVPFAVWTRRSESWDKDHLLGQIYHPVMVGMGEHLNVGLGDRPRERDLENYSWAVATVKRADQFNEWKKMARGTIAPDVEGRWQHDVGALRDRWDGVHGRTTQVVGAPLPPPSLRWQVEWDIERDGHKQAPHPFHSYSQVGGRSLPQPAAICFPSLWLGNKTGVERRLGAVPARADEPQLPDLTELDQSGGNAFEVGDILFNAPKAGRLNWPAAWRAKRRSAIMTRTDQTEGPMGTGATIWRERLYFYAGYVFRDQNRSLWRARNSGFSGDVRPEFENHTTPGPPLNDDELLWEWWSSENDPSPAWDPLINQAPTPVDVDVSAGGATVLTSEQAAHALVRFTGTPRSDVDVIVEPGPSGFWTKTFVNDTIGEYGLRVRATDSGSGVGIHQGSAASLFTAGTDVGSLSSPNTRGAPSVSIDTSIGSATTWDEVPVTTTLFDLADPEVRRIDVVITVTNDTRETRGTWSIGALAARVGATASLDGGGQDASAIKTDGGLDAEVVVSGTSVQLKCTGLVDTHLTWGWEVRGQQQKSATA